MRRCKIVLAMCLTLSCDDDNRPAADASSNVAVDAEADLDAAEDVNVPLFGHDAEVAQPVCNGQFACRTRYGQIIAAATHISAATRSAAWTTSSQNLGIREQLDSDALALTLELFEHADGWLVCNRSCDTGSVSLESVLDEIHSFLLANTAKVVTLLIKTQASRTNLSRALEGAGVSSLLYEHRSGENWPELIEMIEANHRLVVFASTGRDFDDEDGGSEVTDDDLGFVHSLDRWVGRTRDDATVLGTIDCRIVAGDPNAPFILLHHHVSDPDARSPTAELARMANEESAVASRLEACRSLHGSYPSFVALDFFETGDALRVIQRTNRDSL